MKVNELMTGNFFQYEECFYSVESISKDKVLGKNINGFSDGDFPIDKMLGIKITKEVLIKLGFEPKKYELQFEIGLFIFAFDVELNLIIHWGTGQLDEGLDDIVYVHQLQNLIFALTGEKLHLLSA